MVKIEIGSNESGQRLDRFLKKYFPKAPLSLIYKLIRKDLKVNGKRAKESTVLECGDELTIYMGDVELKSLAKEIKPVRAKKQFSVIYEDENILIADKPFGLLTHGDSTEKKNHLANQVIDYLIEKKEYNPRDEKTFVPAPANRLDRNTTGLVIFGKNAEALKELNKMFRERDTVEKTYLTIVTGIIESGLFLKDSMVKDGKRNLVAVVKPDEEGSKLMVTEVKPILISNKSNYTLAEAKIFTGRTHQIRVQLAEAGHPIIGDAKYGNRRINEFMKSKFNLTTQLLHSYKLKFKDEEGYFRYLFGREFTAPVPERFERIKKDIFKND